MHISVFACNESQIHYENCGASNPSPFKYEYLSHRFHIAWKLWKKVDLANPMMMLLVGQRLSRMHASKSRTQFSIMLLMAYGCGLAFIIVSQNGYYITLQKFSMWCISLADAAGIFDIYRTKGKSSCIWVFFLALQHIAKRKHGAQISRQKSRVFHGNTHVFNASKWIKIPISKLGKFCFIERYVFVDGINSENLHASKMHAILHCVGGKQLKLNASNMIKYDQFIIPVKN